MEQIAWNWLVRMRFKPLRNKERAEGGGELREAERDQRRTFFKETKIGFRLRVFIWPENRPEPDNKTRNLTRIFLDPPKTYRIRSSRVGFRVGQVKCSVLSGTSSIHMEEPVTCIACLASLWATKLPSQRTWETLILWKDLAKIFSSWIKWPKEARKGAGSFSELITKLDSP